MVITETTANRTGNKRTIGIFVLMSLLGGCLNPNVGGPIVDRNTLGAGVLERPGLRKVWISPHAFAYTGKGTYTWPDGRVYRGVFRNGRPNGFGREELPHGETYVGHWLDGQRHGQGTLDLSDGTRYLGSFESGNRHGLGYHKSYNGSYNGYWVMDTPHGHGEFTYNDGATYIGEWSGGRQDGEGIYWHPKGIRYDGEWYQGVPHGHGTMSEPDGRSYSGEWLSGVRAGYGRLTTRSGTTYEGTWDSDQRHGFGLESYPDNSQYKGEWANDQRNGEGRAQVSNRFEHEGNWENNISLGPGTRSYTTGIEITGIWNSDSVSSGILKLPSGNEYAGDLYDNDNAVMSPLLLAWLRKTAIANNGHAQLLLGDAYSKHESPKPNLNQAKKWYQQAAKAGIAEAQYELGKILITQGKIEDGIKSLIEAYNTQHVGASLLLGSFYHLGNHVKKDEKMAKRLFELASKGGSITARNNLAWLLSTSVKASVRDGAKAIKLIRPIAYLYNNWSYFETFAAALAEAGNFTSARDAQTHAISLAKNADIPPTQAKLNEMNERLKLFSNDMPFRELDASYRGKKTDR